MIKFATPFFLIIIVVFCSLSARASVPPDVQVSDEAFAQIQKKAEAGNTDSQFTLGRIYLYSERKDINPETRGEQGIYWLKEASDKGNMTAAALLGAIYSYGEDGLVQQNIEEAKAYFLRSAELGYTDIQVNIGTWYTYGSDVFDKDLEQARYWLEKAKEGGNDRADQWIAVLEANSAQATKTTQNKNRRKGLARNSKQRNFDKNFNAMLKKAESGDSENQRTVGLLYLLGRQDGEVGIDKDVDTGIDWLTKASNGKDSEAAKILGMHYLRGFNGVSKNITLAEKFLVRTAELGDSEIQIFVGYSYALGEEFNQDRDKAKYWLERARDSGNAEAEIVLYSLKLHDMQDPEYAFSDEGFMQSRKMAEGAYRASNGEDASITSYLARMYVSGQGGKKNEKKAFKLYKEAYRIDPKFAVVNIGRMYEQGQAGKKASIKKAEKYYREAIELEVGMGAFYLGYLIERKLLPPDDGKQNHLEAALSLYNQAIAKNNNEFVSCFLKLMRRESESGNAKKYTPSERYKFCADKFFADNRIPLPW